MHEQSLYVQIGCGFCAPSGWRNFDGSSTLRFERIPIVGRVYTKNAQRFPPNVEYGDIARGLPIRGGSCAGIYASHVLEHLALGDLRRALANCHTYLRAGGRFRMIVPDMEAMCRDYLRRLDGGDRQAALALMDGSALGWKERPRGLRGAVMNHLTNSRHLWMWDYASLSLQLEECQFTGIRRCACGDCEDEAFRMVEDPRSFTGCLAIECTK